MAIWNPISETEISEVCKSYEKKSWLILKDVKFYGKVRYLMMNAKIKPTRLSRLSFDESEE